MQVRGPEGARNRSQDEQDQEEPEVEGHHLRWGPEKYSGPEKQSS